MVSMFVNMQMPEYKFEDNKIEETKEIPQKSPYDYKQVHYQINIQFRNQISPQIQIIFSRIIVRIELKKSIL